MATTTNFGWETPDDTDLVKDGALAIRTLGSAIDTSLVDLKGGTTGQVLSKTSNTDMDFTWVTSDDANAIQNAIVDAKGDLIAASAADTPARLAVGNNGETLVADSSASTGLRWQGDYAAGKNKLVNADFRVNQRSFSSTTTNDTYTFDRWKTTLNGTQTYSAQTFTPGTAPVAGYEGTNFMQIVTTTGATSFAILEQRIEDVRTFANQTVTLSFWAKANSGTPLVAGQIEQNFGSGGSSAVNSGASTVTISTSWARYSITFAVPSISGKTIGTSSYLGTKIHVNNAYEGPGQQANTFQIWGVQLEAGNVATAFQTATGTLAGELAACQRYYFRTGDGSAYRRYATGQAYSATQVLGFIPFPVVMRTNPTALEQSGTASHYGLLTTTGNVSACTSVPAFDTASVNGGNVIFVSTGLGSTAGYASQLFANNTSSAYLAWSAEL